MNTLMNNNLRIVGFITGILLLVLTLGFVFQFPWVVNLWPWPESRLSYLFLGSILAAITVAVVSVLCLFVQKSIYIGPIRAGGAIMVAALYNLQRMCTRGKSYFEMVFIPTSHRGDCDHTDYKNVFIKR